jgi:phosphotriesterase-related protein
MNKKDVIRAICTILLFSQCSTKENGILMTVNGPIPARAMGVTLEHEHIMVDFIGADSITPSRWDKNEVARVALPYLHQIKELGCRTLLECTPAYLGRDPLLLKELSSSSGLNIITNTGFYGAGNNKYIPRYAFDESADELAARWTNEWENGIDDTKVKPGFIKIGVGGDSLSDFHKKLVRAAALTHLKTGLTVASHTGPSVLAFEQIEILKNEGVSPGAFVWVHAQSEKDLSKHVKAANTGAWISLDGFNEKSIDEYVRMIKNMKENNFLGKVLLSHDSGWYHPGKKNGGDFKGYTSVFEKLIPILKIENFSEKEIYQLLVVNPAEAFSIRVRRNN